MDGIEELEGRGWQWAISSVQWAVGSGEMTSERGQAK